MKLGPEKERPDKRRRISYHGGINDALIKSLKQTVSLTAFIE